MDKPITITKQPVQGYYNCDCMELMAKYPDKYFELAIVDPPYGIFNKKKSASMNWQKSGSGGTWASKYGKKAEKWDLEPEPAYFEELNRISRNQIIWGANHFGIKTDNYVIWRKLTISESFTMGMCEFASVSLKGNPKVFECKPQDTFRFHPTQKPVKLYKWLLELYANPGDKILDTHMGSGSIAIACHYMGYNLTACEIDENYYKAAIKRIKEETAQLDLLAL